MSDNFYLKNRTFAFSGSDSDPFMKFATSTDFIWVSTEGNDTTGNGSFLLPYLTITQALASVTATRLTIMVMPGEYAEVDLVWPNTSGIKLIGAFGGVSIVQATDAATALITVSPTSTTSWTGSISNIEIVSDYSTGAGCTCLHIANANMTATKKINFYLDNVDLSAKAVTDKSLIVVGTVAGAIRVYARGNFNTWEGLVDFTAFNTGDRLRVYNTRIIGSITMNEAVIAELTFINCGLTQSLTVDTNTRYTVQNCWHESDADPNVYTAYTDALSQ